MRSGMIESHKRTFPKLKLLQFKKHFRDETNLIWMNFERRRSRLAFTDPTADCRTGFASLKRHVVGAWVIRTLDKNSFRDTTPGALLCHNSYVSRATSGFLPWVLPRNIRRQHILVLSRVALSALSASAQFNLVHNSIFPSTVSVLCQLFWPQARVTLSPSTLPRLETYGDIDESFSCASFETLSY